MFNNSRKAETASWNDKIDTIIGEHTNVEGTLHTKDTTRIDGRIKGEAISDGYLIIGEGGYVEGDVRSENMLIAGTVHGNVYVKDRLEITESGKIIGDITTKSLVIAEGASFAGKCTMAALLKGAENQQPTAGQKELMKNGESKLQQRVAEAK
ncbi:hypothetical protein GCWU000341_01146 [Oribacterium sp. oral taxon 078 str. F0262]|uniref:bactofilin family protein n=1 Tax=Oribacterium sp. oral taxon 078 TaxID=652706 RepID=UPI0001BCC0BA|nr:polymer-forming cytoskeletal protein [Oribacterium sp. oral taxon 078]EFE91962.1 hypothetical protein GCWU000341_01146 [Oribacterium sp. oral taxon 078 str. F0262]